MNDYFNPDDEELDPSELPPVDPSNIPPSSPEEILARSYSVDPQVAEARQLRDKQIADATVSQGITELATALASQGRVKPSTAVFDAIKKNSQEHAEESSKDVALRQKTISDYIKNQAAQKKAVDSDEWRKKNFEQRDRAIEATRINRETDRTDKKEHEAKPSDSQVSTITDFDNVLKSLNEIEANKDKFDTGPIAGRLHSAAAVIGIADPKKAAFAASVGENLADYLKSKSGATVSAQERSQLMQNVPTINDNDEIFKEKVKYLRNRIGDHRNTFLGNAEKQGKNVTAFKGSAGGFPRKVSNGAGKVATVSNESEAQAAAAKGFH
jgi:hypothetical protein